MTRQTSPRRSTAKELKQKWLGKPSHFLFVPEVGFEPTRPFGQSILSAPRLPFRHSGRTQPHKSIQSFSPPSLGKSHKVNNMSEESRRTAIVAEDEAIIRLDIVETLREAGFDVVAEAGDGVQAVELAKTHQPDIVVMDIKMPNMDGIEAAEQIAPLKIPVVLLTAFSQRELVERASEAGAMAYVVKPFSPNDLLPAVEIALSRFAQLTALESEIADLSERLATRKLVDQAKGLLISKNLVKDEPEAFRWIQKSSMDRRLTMAQVAKTVIDQLSDKPKAE